MLELVICGVVGIIVILVLLRLLGGGGGFCESPDYCPNSGTCNSCDAAK